MKVDKYPKKKMYGSAAAPALLPQESTAYDPEVTYRSQTLDVFVNPYSMHTALTKSKVLEGSETSTATTECVL